MSDMKAFEIHTFQGGKWKIDSVFDDRDLALFEAQRMDESGRYSGVRVVEEVYVETTQETRTRTIFRGTKIEAHNAAELRKSADADERKKLEANRERRKQEVVIKRKIEQRQKIRKKSSPTRLILILMFLAILAGAGMYGIQHLQSGL